MLVRITAGPGTGTIVDLIPAVAIARINGGTAIPVKEERERGVVGHVVDGVREAAARVVSLVKFDPTAEAERTTEAQIHP